MNFCNHFKEMYQPNTNIVTSGCVARSFFIIKQGIVVCDREEARRSDLYHLGEGSFFHLKFDNFELLGDYFGLESFITIINPRSVTSVIAESWVEVIQLEIRQGKVSFKNLKEHFQCSERFHGEIERVQR